MRGKTSVLRDLAILLVLVYSFVPDAISLIEDLPNDWQVATIAWHTLATG